VYYPEVLGPLRADERFGPLLSAVRAYYGLEPDGSLSVALTGSATRATATS